MKKKKVTIANSTANPTNTYESIYFMHEVIDSCSIDHAGYSANSLCASFPQLSPQVYGQDCRFHRPPD